MTLLEPVFLWTLAALAPLIAIYFLKVRPRTRPVTAYFLWQKVFTEKKASALFKRLRDLWSLLLLALAFAAIAFALAEPDFSGAERKDLLIVVDHSASMSAREGSGTRLDLAKKRARSLIEGLNGSQRAAVAAFASETLMLAQPTRHRKTLLEAIDAIEPTELPSRVNALRSLHPGSEWLKNIRVLLITDGCLDDPSRLPEVEVIRVGIAAENIGIARADLRRVPGGKGRLGLFLLPVSSFANPVRTDITLTHVDSNRIIRVIPVTLQLGQNPAISLLLDDAPAGRWMATLGITDALAADNTVSLCVPPSHPVPVGILADDPFFLEHAVTAFEQSEELLQIAPDGKSADLLLSLGKNPSGTSALVFQPQGESPFWSTPGEELASPVPKILAKDHPLLRFLDAETINFTGARRMTSPNGAAVIMADLNGTPLVYLMRQRTQTVCVLNLDPLASQFYLSAWFPVLVHNAAIHLTNRGEPVPATVPTGDLFRVPGLASDATATLKGPLNNTVPLTGASLPKLTRTGFYEVTQDEQKWPAGCSLVAPEESLLRDDRVKDSARPVAMGQSPAYWLLVMAVVTLAGESILYHRRKVG